MQNEGRPFDAAAAVCHSTDWRVLVLVPTRTLLASTFSLYFQILGVVALCLVVFAVLIWHFYRRFMAPLAQLEQAMRQADAGDLKAYVKPQGSVEVVRMMEGYNAILDSLRTGIEQQMEMQRRRQDLEMQVLMSQINPHFLYNTLESIVWKAGEAGRPDIGKLASSLAQLYRLSISGGLFVPLKQELEHVQMYMNIQRSRYGNKVDYEVRLHRVDPDGVEVLKLILQPIVENSLLYGMDGLDHTLRIRVAAWRREGKLVLTVTDNGVGMDKAALAALRQQIIPWAQAEGRGQLPQRRHRAAQHRRAAAAVRRLDQLHQSAEQTGLWHPRHPRTALAGRGTARTVLKRQSSPVRISTPGGAFLTPRQARKAVS